MMKYLAFCIIALFGAASALRCVEFNLSQCSTTAYCVWEYNDSVCKETSCYPLTRLDCTDSYHCGWSFRRNQCHPTRYGGSVCYTKPDSETCVDDANCEWNQSECLPRLEECYGLGDSVSCSRYHRCRWSYQRRSCSPLGKLLIQS